MAVRLSASRAGRLLLPENIPGTHTVIFLKMIHMEFSLGMWCAQFIESMSSFLEKFSRKSAFCFVGLV
jgi:hypothetical protein